MTKPCAESCPPGCEDTCMAAHEAAHARLISAAPDLLAALERIVSDYQNVSVVVTQDGINGAIVAIAKATGDS